MLVLAGDIGGTKALLALVEVEVRVEPQRLRVLESRRYESSAHAGLESVCRTFAADTGRPLPARAGIGVAGPVTEGRCSATNLPWTMDEADLRRRLGMERVKLVNDFGALGL